MFTQWSTKKGWALVAITAAALIGPSTVPVQAFPLSRGAYVFTTEIEKAKPPKGWIDFCRRYAPECDAQATEPRNIKFDDEAWDSIVGANKWVNEHIRPITDMRHWHVGDKWDYPNDGRGDCEDYALLKRSLVPSNVSDTHCRNPKDSVRS